MRPPRPPREIPPPLELECLKALWILGESNVRGVKVEIEPRRKLAYTTVMTLLERLVKKGGVSRKKVGRAFIYSPELSRETLRRRALRELTDIYFDGSQQALIEYLTGIAAAPVRTAAAVVSDGDEQRLDATLL